MTRERSAPSIRTAPRRLRSASGLDGMVSAAVGARADIGTGENIARGPRPGKGRQRGERSRGGRPDSVRRASAAATMRSHPAASRRHAPTRRFPSAGPW